MLPANYHPPEPQQQLATQFSEVNEAVSIQRSERSLAPETPQQSIDLRFVDGPGINLAPPTTAKKSTSEKAVDIVPRKPQQSS